MRERSNRIQPSCFHAIAIVAVVFLLAALPALAQTTFLVTDSAEFGDGTCDATCTLTDAVLAVNAAICVDVAPCTIAFAGPMSISFAVSPLPIITNSYVTIDASANGASMLNSNPFGTAWNGSLTSLIGPGMASGWNAIEAGAGTTKIEIVGLRIEGFGTGIKLDSLVSSVRGCWITNNTTGLILSGPGPGHIGEDLSSVATDGYRNVFSGNATGHIQILSPSTGNRIVNNYIGPMPDLSSAPVVQSQWGIQILADSNTVGAPGAPNLISGNGANSIAVRVEGNANQVLSNFIGTDGAGTAAYPIQSYYGIWSSGAASTLTITGNVVGGHTARGMELSAAAAVAVSVTGNYIGTDATGTASVGNGVDGIAILGPSPISLKTGDRFVPKSLRPIKPMPMPMTVDVSGNTIHNNSWGVVLNNPSGVTVMSNSIVGNGTGIRLLDASGNLVSNNLISTSGYSGVYGELASSYNRFLGNTITGNPGPGISFDSGVGNEFLGNVINGNDIGIDLWEMLEVSFNLGPTPNDSGDGDLGSNNYQNYPEPVSAIFDGTSTQVTWSLDSANVSGTLAVIVEVYKASLDTNPQTIGTPVWTSGCLAGNSFSNQTANFVPPTLVVGDAILMTATSYADSGCATANDGTSELSPSTAVLSVPGVVYTTASSGPGSLYQAVLDANDGICVSPCSIQFKLPDSELSGTAPNRYWRIPIDAPHPLMVNAANVTIDGATQIAFRGSAANATGGPEIFIDGTLAGGDGVIWNGSGTLTHVAVGNCSTGAGVKAAGPDVKVDYCSIGMTPLGAAAPNATGVFFQSGPGRIWFNKIKFNVGNAVTITGGSGVDMFWNDIASNGFGVDLNGDGATPNDDAAEDADVGGNGLQNYPTIKSAYIMGATTRLMFDIHSGTDTSTGSFQVALFLADPNGQGMTQHAYVCVNGNPLSGGAWDVPSVDPAQGLVLTATAMTSCSGAITQGTSEFSPVFYASTPGEVTNTNDSGPGSLRDAMLAAGGGYCADPCTITFSGAGQGTINLLSPLPALLFVSNVTIDGFANGAGTPNTNPFGMPDNSSRSVQVLGQGPGSFDGFELGGNNNRIRGLVIGNLARGVWISNGTGGSVTGCFIGTDGSAGLNNSTGVEVAEFATGAIIGGLAPADRNVISGNDLGGTGQGINLYFATGASILGNYIGTTKDGATSRPNYFGIFGYSATNNQIGSAAGPNLVSGNIQSGIALAGMSTGNTISGNRIGTTADSSASLVNSYGIQVSESSTSNTIGGATAADGNLVSGNSVGVFLDASSNSLYSNLIGTNAAATAALPNGTGVVITSSGTNNTVGSNVSPNTILGNGIPVQILGIANKFFYNTIGSATLPNTGAVQIDGGSNEFGFNSIAYNSLGIVVTSGTGNYFHSNQIHDNAGIPVDLDDLSHMSIGATPNDAADVDSGGGNNFQNYPVIESAKMNGADLEIRFNVDSSSTSNTSLFVEFFKAGVNGSLQSLTTACYDTNNIPAGTLLTVASAPVTAADSIVATATGNASVCPMITLADGTSEYSPAFAINGPPTAIADGYTTAEDTPLLATVLGNDTDPDLDTLTISGNTAATNGSVACTITDCTYTPFGDYSGGDSFDYTITDGNGYTSTATVTLTVTPVNDPPVATTDVYTTAEDAPLTIAAPGVLANDTDIDSAPSSFVATIASPAANGSVVLNADGSFTYTPTLDYSGPDSFAYNLSDGAGGTAMGFVNLTVTPVNDPPVAAADSYTTSEDLPLSIPAPGVLSNDTDVDSAPQFFMSTIGTPPTNGTVDVLGSDGSFTYTPFANFSGSDSFTYILNDGSGGTATGTVSITVTGVNDPPVAVGDSYTTAEDTPLTIAAPGVLANDTDADGPALTATLTTPADYGLIVLNLDGSFTYTPAADMTGMVYASYTVSDGAGGSASTSIMIDVTPVNDPPVAVADGYMTSEDTPLAVGASMGLLANDTDVDSAPSSLVAASGTPPSYGNVTVNADGSFIYTPMPDYSGTDSFGYTVSDGAGGITPGTVSLLVNAVNDAPVAVDDAASTTSATAITTAVLSNDSDIDADPLTVVSWTSPSNGNVTCTSFDCTYTSNPDFAGPDTYTYTITDGFTTATATVTVTVTLESDVMISISATPEPVSAGNTITWMIGVGFAGGPNMSATGVTVTDVVPASITNVAVSGNSACSAAGNTVTCTAPSIGIGFLPITITGTAPANGGIITNTVTITTTSSDPNLANNTASASTTVYSTTFAVTSLADSGPGTLRQALLDANSGACASPCVITFAFPPPAPASGYFTIQPLSPLPPITASNVTIDATSQTAATGDTNASGPEVFLDGSLAGTNANGFTIQSLSTGGGSNNVITGFAIGGFSTGAAIHIDGSGGTAQSNAVQGNFLGTDPTGANAAPNGAGIVIGTNATNTLVGGNSQVGKGLQPALVWQGNVISGNVGGGITITGSSNAVLGNYIGTDASGNSPQPNGTFGVAVSGSMNGIGGLMPGSGNVIAFNGTEGVRIDSGTGNSIRGNSIHGNGTLEIDLQCCGVTSNDAGGTDVGPNDLQNWPVIAGASFDGTSTTITGSLDTVPGTYDLDFYESTAADPTGAGEGETWLGSIPVSASTGPTPFTFTVSGDHTAKFLSATATSSTGSTSEFAVALAADLSVTITPPAAIVPGTSAVYTITVTNNGPSAASSVVVTETTPTGFTFVSNSGACTTPYPCTIASLASAASQTITTTFGVPASYTTPNPASNTATVNSTVPDPNTLDNTATVSTAVAVSADIAITKTASSPSVIAESALNYTLNVTNAGPSDAVNVTVTDPLPAGYLVGSITQSGWTCSQTGQTVTCTKPALGAGTGSTITINGAAPPVAGSITNTATVSSATADPASANNTASATTTVVTNADLSISKTASATPVNALGSFTYTLAVTNNGPNTASSVAVSDTLPAGMTLVSASGAGWTCTQSAGVVSCTLPTLTSSTTSQITLAVKAPTAGGTITNTATVSSATTDPVSTNNTASATTTVNAVADLKVTKTASVATAVVGDPIVYSITVTNNGPSQALAVSVSDPTPAALTWMSTSGDCVTAFPCGLGTLGAGVTKTITATYKVSAVSPSPVVNTASASSSTTDPTPADNSASASTSILDFADLTVTKVASVSTATLGDTVVFTISVKNNGPSTAQNVVASDPTPAALTFLSNSGACGMPFPCSLGTLGAGVTKTVTATYEVSGKSPTAIVNTASVSSSTADPNAADNTASASITTCPVAVSVMRPVPNATGVPTTGLLNWDRVDAASYTVYLGRVGSGCQTLLGSTTSNSIQYTNLEPGTTYEWRVVAIKPACGAVSSACVKFTTAQKPCENTAPSPIEPAAGANVVANPVTFTWSAPSGAIGYNVYAGVNGAVPSLIAPTTTATTLSVDVSAGAVVWYVDALFDGCPAMRSPQRTFTAGPLPCDSHIAPDPLLPDDGVTMVSPMSFRWSAAPAATGYRVWVSIGDAFPFIVASTATETTATASVPAGTLHWFVEALFEGCPPMLSTLRTLTVVAASTCPTTPPSLGEPANGVTIASPVTFSWTQVPDAFGYTVWLGLDDEAPSIVGTTSGAAATSLTREVQAGHAQWFVEAMLANCNPLRSSVREFTVPVTQSCGNAAPALVAPAGGATDQPGLIEFSWTAVDNATEYRVWAKVDGGDESVVASTLVTTRALAPAVGTTVEWWVQALFNGCPAVSSEHRTFTLARATSCSGDEPTLLAPANQTELGDRRVLLSWGSVANAVGYRVRAAVNQGAYATVAIVHAPTTAVTIDMPYGAIGWFVEAITSGCPLVASEPGLFTVRAPAGCDVRAARLVAPPNGLAGLTSPVQFGWTPVDRAVGYRVWVSFAGGAFAQLGTMASTTSVTSSVPQGLVRWYVEAVIEGCEDIRSSPNEFTVVAPPSCTTPDRTVPAVVAQISVGKTYRLTWAPVAGSTIYEVQESSGASFTGAPVTVIQGTFVERRQAVPGTYSYRVRAIGDCNQERGPYSEVVSVRVAEEESEGGAEAGDTGTLTTLLYLCINAQGQVVICEEMDKRGKSGVHPSDGTTVGVSTSTPWMTVSPSTVTIPQGGTATVTVTSTTGGLPVGANTGAVTVTPTSTSAPASSLPNTVSLVTPVSPTPRNEPAPESLIIPAVAHASGTNSTWLSDIRLANIASQLVNYQINFTPAGMNGTQVGQQTTLSLDGGKTTALNDIVASWFGGGSAGQAASGVLEIRPLNSATSALSTIASSRTYNLSAAGTFGQFIPAVLFSQFVGKAPDAGHPTTLSLQQISQSSSYRTNFGLVEASGHPATVEFTVFGDDGTQVASFPISLQAGEYRQYNALLADHGITLDDGRVEINVTSDEGKVTAYASVVDNGTNDPLVVPAVQLANVSTDKYIVPGVAEVSTGSAHWRTDMRLFNASPSVIHATVTFYPQGNPADVHSADVTVQPGEVKVVNSALATLFGLDNVVGVIHVTTPSATRFLVTARTYDQQPAGTYGQFIPAMTVRDSIGLGERPLQILQLEQSDAFRTNVGIAEVTGRAANIEVVATVPDKAAAAVLAISLRPNEFVQLSRVLSQMGITNAYNARISVRVTGGEGRVIAYGSVVDNQTQDPTYVPAQ